MKKILLLISCTALLSGCGMTNDERISLIKKCHKEKLGINYSFNLEPFCDVPSVREKFEYDCIDRGMMIEGFFTEDLKCINKKED